MIKILSRLLYNKIRLNLWFLKTFFKNYLFIYYFDNKSETKGSTSPSLLIGIGLPFLSIMNLPAKFHAMSPKIFLLFKY